MHVDPAVKVLATTRLPTADGPHVGNGPVDMPVVWTKMFRKRPRVLQFAGASGEYCFDAAGAGVDEAGIFVGGGMSKTADKNGRPASGVPAV